MILIVTIVTVLVSYNPSKLPQPSELPTNLRCRSHDTSCRKHYILHAMLHRSVCKLSLAIKAPRISGSKHAS